MFLYEELIYSSLEGKRVVDGRDALLETFKCLSLSSKAREELSTKAKEFGENKELFTREERKELTRTLRDVNYIDKWGWKELR